MLTSIKKAINKIIKKCFENKELVQKNILDDKRIRKDLNLYVNYFNMFELIKFEIEAYKEIIEKLPMRKLFLLKVRCQQTLKFLAKYSPDPNTDKFCDLLIKMEKLADELLKEKNDNNDKQNNETSLS